MRFCRCRAAKAAPRGRGPPPRTHTLHTHAPYTGERETSLETLLDDLADRHLLRMPLPPHAPPRPPHCPLRAKAAPNESCGAGAFGCELGSALASASPRDPPCAPPRSPQNPQKASRPLPAASCTSEESGGSPPFSTCFCPLSHSFVNAFKPLSTGVGFFSGLK